MAAQLGQEEAQDGNDRSLGTFPVAAVPHKAQDGQDEAQEGQEEGQEGQEEAQDGQDEGQDGQDEAQEGQEEAQEGQEEAKIRRKRAYAIFCTPPTQFAYFMLQGDKR